MAVQVGTTYQQVLGAVGDYYGVGSDQWLAIARNGFTAENAESILSQVPDVSIYKNRAGEITGYAYNAPFTYDSGGIAGDINSNVQLPTQGNGNTFKANIPASGGTNQQTGNVDLSSGAKRVSDNTTVPSTFSTVTTAIAGLSFGARLGKNILQSLYNGNPDYWESTFPTINPQTWDSIAGNNQLGKSVINAIFGIDKSTGQTQMYLPEDALAYYAYAMKEQGFFRTGEGGEITQGDSWAQSQTWYSNYHMPIPAGGSSGGWDAPSYTRTFSGTFERCWVYKTTPSLYSIELVSSQPFTYTETNYNKNTGNTSTTTGSITSGGTINNKRVYKYSTAFSTNSTPSISPYNYSVPDGYGSYLVLYGTYQDASGHEGVEPQDGAPTYNTSGWTDPAATATDLKANHPDLYNGSIYTDVPQPDGSTKRIIYVPVNTTGTKGDNDDNPTNTEVTYDETTVSGDSTDDLLKTIIRYITETQSENKNDTPNPPNTPNPTDTGTGSTPPVIPPTGQASALFAIYNPSQAQLNSFGAWLWSSNFIDQVLKLFNNPMQAIIGLHKIFAAPAISGTGNIRVGYLDSGVGANLVGAQYTSVDCGSVRVAEEFGNVFDYTDTHIRLYLPFIGIVDLDTADVMRGSVSVKYHVDVITGACLAEVKISRDSSGGTLYQYAGDASVRYPISSGSYMGIVSGVLSAVGGIASAVMTGGATLPLAAGAVAGGISGAHTQVQHSGNFSGNAGAMGAKKPYLIIERPQTAIAEDFAGYQGKGANSIRAVADMSGYFKMTDVHTDSVNGASESELDEIKTALERGVIK